MNVYSTVQLLGMVAQVDKLETFFLNMFFPLQVNFETKEIMFDKVVKGKKLAPLVSPMVAGKPARQKGMMTSTFLPAYVKPMDVVEPGQLLVRQAGEAIGGALNSADRRSAKVVELLMEQDEEITRREEVMAAQAVLEGRVVVEGKDYERQEVNYNRRAENSIALVGVEKWDSVDKDTYDPTDDLEDWAANSKGVISTLVFSKEGYRLFSKFKVVKEKLDQTQANGNSSLNMGPQTGDVKYKGTFGDFDVWVYAGKYDDDDGNEVEIMPGAKLLMAPSGYQGVRCYGAIQDAEANANGLVAASRYPDNWFTKNPSVENLMTQSAPLPVTPDADQFVVIELA